MVNHLTIKKNSIEQGRINTLEFLFIFHYHPENNLGALSKLQVFHSHFFCYSEKNFVSRNSVSLRSRVQNF